ncbi:hypothetical protein C8J57DRAFT_1490013 [Mycena rebaudengoi]|nr:hypothetical protein C8J57DRAFT_1490013 [Mycena rebaudengoi]
MRPVRTLRIPLPPNRTSRQPSIPTHPLARLRPRSTYYLLPPSVPFSSHTYVHPTFPRALLPTSCPRPAQPSPPLLNSQPALRPLSRPPPRSVPTSPSTPSFPLLSLLSPFLPSISAVPIPARSLLPSLLPGIVYNVTPAVVGVIVYKVIGNRYIEKRVNLRVEHVQTSKCR